MSRSDIRPLSALTIAGSDSGGGAGIQADLKTFAAHGVHGLSAIAALTAQHTRGVTAVHVPSVAFLRAQIDACFDDFRIGAVKLGMLANTEVITAVADALEHHQPSHIVLDPVMVATSGARLLAADALDALRARLLPLATILTPNIPEAELLLGHPIDDDEAADAALVELLTLGARAMLLKGGHLQGPAEMVDRYSDGQTRAEFAHDRLDVEGHGAGCTLASAIAANLGLGMPLLAACEAAADYVHGALRHATRPGRSRVAMLDHFWQLRGHLVSYPKRSSLGSMEMDGKQHSASLEWCFFRLPLGANIEARAGRKHGVGFGRVPLRVDMTTLEVKLDLPDSLAKARRTQARWRPKPLKRSSPRRCAARILTSCCRWPTGLKRPASRRCRRRN